MKGESQKSGRRVVRLLVLLAIAVVCYYAYTQKKITKTTMSLDYPGHEIAYKEGREAWQEREAAPGQIKVAKTEALYFLYHNHSITGKSIETQIVHYLTCTM